MPRLELTTTLQPRGPAAAVVLTDAQVASLEGGAKVFPVTVTVAGHTFAGRVARMGGENLVGLSKAVRAAAGVEAGDEVVVVLEPDTEPRTVELPADLVAVLGEEPGLREAFDALAPSRRKELVRRVEDAKRPATRKARLAEAVEVARARRG